MLQQRRSGLAGARAIEMVFAQADSPFSLREFTDRVNAILAADADDPMVVRHFEDRDYEVDLARERDAEAVHLIEDAMRDAQSDPWRDVRWSDDA